MENELSSENQSEVTSENPSEVTSENPSEVTSENPSELSSDTVLVYTEVALPEETSTQIAEIHTVCITGLAIFGTMFFLWLLDFCYKKISKLF